MSHTISIRNLLAEQTPTGEITLSLKCDCGTVMPCEFGDRNKECPKCHLITKNPLLRVNAPCSCGDEENRACGYCGIGQERIECHYGFHVEYRGVSWCFYPFDEDNTKEDLLLTFAEMEDVDDR